MKKFLILLLCMSIFLCVLVSCGETENDPENETPGSSSTNGNGTGESVDDGDNDDGFVPNLDEVKYQYNLEEYLELPLYNGYEIEISLDAVQQQIDTFIMEKATMSKKTVCMVGDVVNIGFIGYRLDEGGEIQYNDKGEPEIFEEAQSYGVYLGSHMTVSEFETGIIGMKIGDIKEVYVTFPNDYFEKSLAGKTVMFEIMLNAIFDSPVFNDEFVQKNFQDYDSVESYVRYVKNSTALNDVYKYIIENTVVKSYPTKEYDKLAKELESIADNFKDDYKIELDVYLEQEYGLTRDEYIKEQLLKEMVFYAIASKEGLVPTDDEIIQERKELVEYYTKEYNGSGMNYRDAQAKAKDFVNSLGTSYLYENVIYEKVDAKLAELAKITEKPMTYKSVTQYLSEREGKETGKKVGDLCPSFEAEVFDENGSLSTTVDPTRNVGRITVINLWGTWCGPCRNELPDFDRVATEYADQLTVFAIHSSYNYGDASEYVLNNFKDSNIIFLKDYLKNPDEADGEDVLYELLCGTGYYPHTLILDESGKIISVTIGAITYDKLITLLEQAGLEK